MRIKKIVFGEHGFIASINTGIIEFSELETPVIPNKCCQNCDLW